MIGGLFIATELAIETAYMIDDGEPYGEDLTKRRRSRSVNGRA
jgi:hypothetical protein